MLRCRYACCSEFILKISSYSAVVINSLLVWHSKGSLLFSQSLPLDPIQSQLFNLNPVSFKICYSNMCHSDIAVT